MSRTEKPLMILVAGEPVASALAERGSFSRMIRETVGTAWPGRWSEADLRAGADLPVPNEAAGIIVTGSSASVTDRAPWILHGEAYLRRCVGERVPVFGICFGHQMLASALGGEVARNPAGREIGTVEAVHAVVDPLLAPERPRMKVNTTHVDTVVRPPSGAVVVSTTARERHAALRFGEAAWGVQFHPEMDAEIIRHYIASRRSLVVAEGLDADALLTSAQDTPESVSILKRFAGVVARLTT